MLLVVLFVSIVSVLAQPQKSIYFEWLDRPFEPMKQYMDIYSDVLGGLQNVPQPGTSAGRFDHQVMTMHKHNRIAATIVAPDNTLQNTIAILPHGPQRTQQTARDTDPQETRRFVQHFKQRRLELDMSQAKVVEAIRNLEITGAREISKWMLYRFENLLLKPRNVVKLKPIIQAWLEETEKERKSNDLLTGMPGLLPTKKRIHKRRSCAERQYLEDFFRHEQRPNHEQISEIANTIKLDEKCVRNWFKDRRKKPQKGV